jgi:U3 small nucleolar RNA-associated protein 18
LDKIGPLLGREEKSLEVFAVFPDSKTIAFVGNEGYYFIFFEWLVMKVMFY